MAEGYTRTAKGGNPIALGVVLAVICFILIAPIKTAGDAMAPSIKDNDIIIIQKKTYSENRGLPEYGDIVAFKGDFYDSGKKGEQRLARIIGLPGDEITVDKGKVLRNGKAVDESGYKTEGKTKGNVKVKLDKDEIFVLCDNRGEAIDSRHDKVGALSLEKVRGKVLVRLWPLNKIGTVK